MDRNTVIEIILSIVTLLTFANVVNAQDAATDIAKNPLTSTATGLNLPMETNPEQKS